MRYQFFFLLWCAIPSGRALKKRSCALVSLSARGSCASLHVSSSAGVRVLISSEARAVSHSVSLVHISSILLSAHSCPIVSSPVTDGKFHPTGATWAIPLWRVFHVVW